MLGPKALAIVAGLAAVLGALPAAMAIFWIIEQIVVRL